jgi:hypothetical protein
MNSAWMQLDDDVDCVDACAAGANPTTAREAATARTAMRFMVEPPIQMSPDRRVGPPEIPCLPGET